MSQMTREDLEDLDEVWVGGDIQLDSDEFIDALDSIEGFHRAIRDIQEELHDLNTGLDREDAIRLIYARNHAVTLGQVEATFDAIDDVVGADPHDVGAVLLNRKTDLTMEEVGQVLEEMGMLASKYAREDDDD